MLKDLHACLIACLKTRPNYWAKQVREIERGHWILDFMIYEMKNGTGKVGRFLKKENEDFLEE